MISLADLGLSTEPGAVESVPEPESTTPARRKITGLVGDEIPSPLDIPDRWCDTCWAAYADVALGASRALTPCGLLSARSILLTGMSAVRARVIVDELAGHECPFKSPFARIRRVNAGAGFAPILEATIDRAFAAEQRSLLLVSDPGRARVPAVPGLLRRLIENGFRLGVVPVVVSTRDLPTHVGVTGEDFGVWAHLDRNNRCWVVRDSCTGKTYSRIMRLPKA